MIISPTATRAPFALVDQALLLCWSAPRSPCSKHGLLSSEMALNHLDFLPRLAGRRPPVGRSVGADCGARFIETFS